MTDRKESQSPQTSPRTKFPNVNSSMSNNASAIHEDDNLIREKNSTRPMNVLQDSRFKPSATKEERPIKYSVEHVALPVFKPTLRGKAISILRSKTAEITIVGLIILYMALVFINIIMDNGIEEDIHVFNAIRGLKFAELGILAIFIAEMLIKIWTFGFKGYFKDIWCIVDSLLVLITFGMIIVDIETEDERYPGMPRVKGLFRLFKVFVVIRKANDIVRISQSKIRTSSLVFKSPVEKVLELFHTFKRCTKDKSLIKQIDWAIEIVSSNRLYEPIIEEGKDEKNEVGVWVKSYQTKGPKDEKKQSTKDLKELIRRTSVMPAAITPSKVPNLIIPFEAREVFSKDIDHLHFDIMEVRDITKGQELAFTALYLFERHSFFDALNIKQETFVKFIKKVQSGYLPNPYHNPTHGADVLQSTNYFLTTGELLSKCQFTELEVASLFIGAAIHDYDHPGTNNAFHINTASSYAITYNDKGVLENHHVSAVFALLQNDSYNIFANFTKEDYKIIRERIIAIVLATDMASHFSDIAKLKGRLAADFDPKDKDKKFMMETIVHAADISNPSKPWDICKEWTTRIVTEFWNQGDKERELGLPITYLCDRYTVNTAKSQIGFIDFVVSPLFVLIKEILPKVDISHLEINKNKWKDLVDFYEQELKTINEAKKAVETKEIAP